MRKWQLKVSGTLVMASMSVAVTLIAQSTMKPGHDRVPPYREPAPFMSAADIQAALSKLDPKLVASRTGGATDFAKDKANGVVRRRMTGPQYAITHTRTLEYVIITKGTGNYVTGGQLIPPTIESDPYPNSNPNATIRSASGVTGGTPRKVGPGDVIVNLPGTPHWLSEIDGTIEYFEIQLGNVDPAPGIERAELLPAGQKPGHDRVPPHREASPYMSAAEIQAALNKLDPKVVASRTGGFINFAEGKASGVVRRRMTGPQYAITHSRGVEYIFFTKGTGTFVTGGQIVPPTIDSDPYPNCNPNATIRSAVGVKGGLARKVGPGDVAVDLPGTPHWFSEIDNVIEYFEITVPNVDPAEGIERAAVLPASACSAAPAGR
jgi:quercetin dioxygenase-like cupin family protein